jgi:hypothetical protein
MEAMKPEDALLPGESVTLPGFPAYRLLRTDDPRYLWELHRLDRTVSNEPGLVAACNSFEGVIRNWRERTEETAELCFHLAGHILSLPVFLQEAA